MKLEQFKKIEKEVKQNFSEKYSGIRTLLYISSYFGNLMSILLAFFFLSKLLLESVSFINNNVLIYGITILILVGLELFKRGLFTKFSLEFVSSKFDLAKKEVAFLGISSLLVIGFSFYSSLRGAAEFTSKDAIISENVEKNVLEYKDSLNKNNVVKFTEIEAEIKEKKDKINKKDIEQTAIQASPKLTKSQMSRVKDLKEEKEVLKSEIKESESKVEVLKSEIEKDVEKYKLEITSKSDDDKNKNKSNSFVFVIISTIVEFLILIGIYFDKHYKWVSYTDYKRKVNNDPMYQKWIVYDGLLDSLYTTETQIGERIGSINNIIDICRTNNILITQKEATECLKLLTNLKILKLSGAYRLIQKDKESAVDLLRENFKID